MRFEVRSGRIRGPGHEAYPLYGRTDHWDFKGARGRDPGRRVMQKARGQRRQHLQMESEVRRDGCIGGQTPEDPGRGEHKLKRMLADAMLDNVALKASHGQT